LIAFSACTSKNENTSTVQESTPSASVGIGPIKAFKFESKVNEQLSAKGKEVFAAKCSACHKIGERYVGPDLKGVTKRREPAWIMNMILNPAEMVQKDPIAQGLLGEFMTQMPFQNVTEDEVKQIVEYFRTQE
jgi:mono/diheme cytochrome c family protein